MKKLFFLVLTVGALATAKAQVQFGVKAGANFATITNADQGKTLVGFHGGALVNLPLIEKLHLQPEVIYSTQGVKFDGGKYKFDYINVPILAQYKFPIGVFVETGPQIGFLASAKAKVDGGESASIKDYSKSVDFSWAAGAGYIIPEINLGFDARFNLGITKVGKTVDGQNYIDGRNVVFQLGVFYLFGGSGK